MKKLMLGLATAGCLVASFSVTAVNAQQTDPQPTCKMCPGTYLPATEIQEYIKKALAEKRKIMGFGHAVYRRRSTSYAPAEVFKGDG